MTITFFCDTDTGNKRRINEDSLYPAPRSKTHPELNNAYGALFVVADGMGGQGSGDHASQLAIKVIVEAYYNPNYHETDIQERLRYAILAAHEAITVASNTPETEKMGTTVVAAVVKDAKLQVAWVGDSRAYRLADTKLEQLTDDHSVLWESIKAGQISWDELHYHTQRSRLTNSVTGRRSGLEVDVREVDLRPGDEILLCSDGLTSEIQDKDIEAILNRYEPSKSAVYLIEAAKKPKKWLKEGQKVSSPGGEDNITTIVIQMPGGKPKAAVVPISPKRSTGISLAVMAGIGLVIFLLLIILGGLGWFLLSPSSTPTPENAQISATAAVVVLASATPMEVATQPINTAEATATLAPGETPKPTSTLAPIIPTPTLTPTVIPTVNITTRPKVTATSKVSTTPVVSQQTITLVEPDDNYVMSPNLDSLTFKWRFDGTCNRPPEGFGFELRIDSQDIAPTHGAMDAVDDQKDITCENGLYSYTVGQVSQAAGVQGQKKLHWDVILVQITPEYSSTNSRAKVLSPYNLELGTEGGGGGGGTEGGGGVTTGDAGGGRK